MPGITSFPRVVRDPVEQFGELLICEPERRHLAEYLTGGDGRRAQDRAGDQQQVRHDHGSVVPEPLPHRGELGRKPS
ncbi:MAG TPA: hypothetical protein EYH34_14145 [Planctomycetes bacterium]|nr:hypothetical protein [Planctomycetota bacterium]